MKWNILKILANQGIASLSYLSRHYADGIEFNKVVRRLKELGWVGTGEAPNRTPYAYITDEGRQIYNEFAGCKVNEV